MVSVCRFDWVNLWQLETVSISKYAWGVVSHLILTLLWFRCRHKAAGGEQKILTAVLIVSSSRSYMRCCFGRTVKWPNCRWKLIQLVPHPSWYFIMCSFTLNTQAKLLWCAFHCFTSAVTISNPNFFLHSCFLFISIISTEKLLSFI